MANMLIYITYEHSTACKDVIKLLDVRRCSIDDSLLEYALYKTTAFGDDNKWIYFLKPEKVPFPIIISEEVANEIMKAPEYGELIVSKSNEDRYR